MILIAFIIVRSKFFFVFAVKVTRSIGEFDVVWFRDLNDCTAAVLN